MTGYIRFIFKANAGLPCYLKPWYGFKHVCTVQKKPQKTKKRQGSPFEAERMEALGKGLADSHALAIGTDSARLVASALCLQDWKAGS